MSQLILLPVPHNYGDTEEWFINYAKSRPKISMMEHLLLAANNSNNIYCGHTFIYKIKKDKLCVM